MALNITEPIANINSSTDSLTYSFGSYTPTAGSRQVVHFTVYGHTDNSGSVSDAGNGLTWTKRDNLVWNAGTATVYMFESSIVPGSPAAMTVTLTVTGATPTGCCATMWQITGSSDPTFVQKKSLSGSGGTAAITMDSALNTNNCYVLGMGSTNNPPNFSPPTSWTETFDNGHPSSEGGYSAFRVNGESGTTITMGSATPSNWGLEVMEYSEGGGGGGSGPLREPIFADLTFGVHRKLKVLGLRSGIAFAWGPTSSVATIVSKAVKPKAKTKSRARLKREIRKGFPSHFANLTMQPIGTSSPPAVPSPFDSGLRRRIVRR